MPINNYTSTLRVLEDEDGKATVEWSSEFDSAGAPESDAMKIVEGIYSAGFDNLKKMFGGWPTETIAINCMYVWHLVGGRCVLTSQPESILSPYRFKNLTQTR